MSTTTAHSCSGAILPPDAIARLFKLQDERDAFEDLIEGIYGALLGSGDVAVDGGANVGRHSFPMARLVGRNGAILAFEPIPNLAEALILDAAKENLDQLRVLQQALATQNGTARFNWIENAPGYSGLQPRSYPFTPKRKLLTVETVMLDAVLAQVQGPWRFGKFDLEGGEFRALQGARAGLQRHRPVLVFENAREPAAKAYGYTVGDFFTFFDGLEYELYDILGRPFSAGDWNNPGYAWYYIGVPRGGLAVQLLQATLPKVAASVLEK